MRVAVREEEDTDLLSLTVKVPRYLPLGIAESLEEGLERAVQILASSTAFRDLAGSADIVARLIVSQVRPGSIMFADRIGQMATVKQVFDEGDWLTAKEINMLQQKPPPRRKSRFRQAIGSAAGVFLVSHMAERTIILVTNSTRCINRYL